MKLITVSVYWNWPKPTQLSITSVKWNLTLNAKT